MGELTKRAEQAVEERGKTNVTSYFYTNSPDNFRAKNMWEVFTRWGPIQEVFIPSKRDKGGKGLALYVTMRWMTLKDLGDNWIRYSSGVRSFMSIL